MWVLLALNIAADKTPQEKYIDRYSQIAVREMQRTGVPASITLAQGILESDSGRSVLAVKGNNHFGIKCHGDWTGKRMYQDDDRKGECFRVYRSAEDSFKDHSEFLRYKDRYRPLFELEMTDYRGWARGLKKAGYATDPAYASKLVRVIEDYQLYRFDGGVVESAVPEPPQVIEQPRRHVGGKAGEEYLFSLERPVYEKNGVPFVYAMEGETYASIAEDNGLFLREILRFNDLPAEEALSPGTVVYLKAKKRQAPKGLDKYVVDRGDTDLRAIAQRFAVRLESIRKRNGLDAGYQPREGDTLLLRGSRKSR